MSIKKLIISSLASLGLALGIASSRVFAQMNHDAPGTKVEQTERFRRIEQPLWVKGAVTAGGLALMGLELWWFLSSKPKSQKAEAKRGVQEVTITVDGGYEPSRVVVNAGQPVRLNFRRRDPSSCLEEVRLPDFRIAQELPLNQTTPIEFTPDKPGKYTFTCGMNMFQGDIEVQPADAAPATTPTNAAQATHRI